MSCACSSVSLSSLKKPRGVDHALAEEGLEEVVAAVVVLADDALVLLHRVDGHLGDHPGDEELHVVARERELDETVARVEKRLHVGDVDVAVEVRFEERGHGDAVAVACIGGELLVVEDDEIGQLGHGCLFFLAGLCGEPSRANAGRGRAETRPATNHVDAPGATTVWSGAGKRDGVLKRQCVASYAMRGARFAVVMVSSRVTALVVGAALAMIGVATPANAQESQLDGLRAAAKANATDPGAALALGRALRRAGHPVDALAELRRGIGVSAAKLDVLVSLHWEVARVQMDRHDFVQTLTACQVLGKLPGASGRGARVHRRRAPAPAALHRGARGDDRRRSRGTRAATRPGWPKGARTTSRSTSARASPPTARP